MPRSRATVRLSGHFLPLLLAGLIIGSKAEAGDALTPADYARAASIRDRSRDKVFRSSVTAHWNKEASHFWYSNDLAGETREFLFVDPAKPEKRAAFDHERLAAALAKASNKPVEPQKLHLDRLAFEPDQSIRFRAFDKGWRYDPKADAVTEAPVADEGAVTSTTRERGQRRGNRADEPENSPTRRASDSPNGKLTTFIRDHDLYLREKSSNDETQLTFDGSEANAYQPRPYWSPDSLKLVVLKTRQGDARKVNLIQSSPSDQLQPKTSTYDYLKPGDQVAVTTPHLFDIATKKENPIDDALFQNPWSIDEYHWYPDSSRFAFLYNQRGHDRLRVLAVDSTNGNVTVLVDEHSKTFIDYAHKTYLRWIENANELIWMSERDGWNHLYLVDSRTGQVKNAITKGEWLVRGVDRFDPEARALELRIASYHRDQDPYYVHFARVNLSGTDFTPLTEGDGTHSIAYSPDRKYYFDTYSRVDFPPVTELRETATGKRLLELERADAQPLLSAGIPLPERFVAKGRDGKTDIHGILIRPSTLDPAKKYPVIEAIYAGPQGQFVPKDFSPLARHQALAELGFIVVQLDGMGTNWRSKAFHDVCAKNLADAGFPDRILWIKAAAQQYPYMDISRVGLFGGSAGGQNALGGLLFHGDFYKVAVADCGCHDNRMDKIWWNEAWMGYPVGPHYAASSNVVHAHRLTGKLLLTVGELDHNVDPASTMQVANALIKAGKDFDLVVFPNSDHGAGGSPYGQRRLRDFFVRHLMGATPPDWNNQPAPASSETADN
jgi:dipeptidyl aminopeptidase/acylaminoacyl peptidase